MADYLVPSLKLISSSDTAVYRWIFLFFLSRPPSSALRRTRSTAPSTSRSELAGTETGTEINCSEFEGSCFVMIFARRQVLPHPQQAHLLADGSAAEPVHQPAGEKRGHFGNTY